MAKSFTELFKKSVFTENELETISKIKSYSVKSNKEKLIVEIEAVLGEYIVPEKLFSIERRIKKDYAVNRVTLFPKFEGIDFSTEYFEDIIKILKNRSQLDYGFFDYCRVTLNEHGQLVINLRDGVTNTIPEANDARKFISNTIAYEFDTDIDIVLVSGNIDVAGYKNDREASLLKEFNDMLQVVAEEKPKPAMRSSFSNRPVGDAEYFEIGEKKLVHVGEITLDITEPKEILGKRKSWQLTAIGNIACDDNVCIGGKLFLTESKENYEGDKISFTLYVTDMNASVCCRFSCGKNEAPSLPKAPAYVLVAGKVEHRRIFDRNTRKMVDEEELNINVKAISAVKCFGRADNADEKRVELHLHTNQSALDALADPADILARADEWGMPAVAFTDHGTLQSYPIVLSAAKKHPGVKPIYGVEGYLVDDTARAVFHYDDKSNINLSDETFIIFDIETTGLSPKNCGITQIGALKYKNGDIIGEFSTFVDPKMPIPPNITELTGITDDMVKGAPSEREAVKAFLDFSEGKMLVAHNANFDTSFIARVCNDENIDFPNAYLDTVAVSRYINSDSHNHKLDTLAKYYKLGDFDHHRADADTEMLARIFGAMVKKLASNGIYTVNEMNEAMSQNCDPTKLRTNHIIILVKNAVGLKNLYKIVSRSYIDYFRSHPRIPKTLLTEYREGLVIGSACCDGELYKAILDNKPFGDLLKIADYYDYIEIQPDSNNGFLVDEGRCTPEQLRQNVKTLISIAQKQNKPFVATGDVHFLDPEDEIYRQLMMNGMKYSDAFRETKLYFRTTEEMLDEFSYLGEETAYKAVIENPKKIIADFEDIKPIPDGTFTPKIEGAEEELQTLCGQTAYDMYGFQGKLPDIVKERMDKELGSIIANGFAVLYVIARRLVRNSEEHGYLVGSRGSVGSSFVATLAKISEVNPLPPHYACPNCKYSEFITDGSVGSGFDLEDKNCPHCGTPMRPDGHDIPFETFLGFHGEKAPDIDLNFSGDVQSEAHKYTEVLFGKENIFRAGTVGTLQDKNCYGFVKKYLEEKGDSLTHAEQARLAYGFVGVKRTTGQHPGGIVVIPKEYEIYDFTPVQYPANKASSGVITTHFAFEYLHDTLLKLDILGHDVPTFYKVLQDYTGVDVLSVKMNDKKVIELFESTEPIGVTPEQIECKIGTLGLPEFGTDYAIQMILDAKPKTFADLLQISGLSHGTGIWLGNGKDLIDSGTCTIDQIIGTRDSIMIYLLQKGLEPSNAFNAMERTRKGKGLTPELEADMLAHDVPQWYIDSCNKIKYMFPKAHAAAYTIASLRLGWFKVYYPIEYYATYFTVKADNFDGALVMQGKAKIEERLRTIKEMPNPTAKDEEQVVFLRVVIEMFARNIGFLPVSIGKSESAAFVPENGKIRLPLCSLNGLGRAVADKIVEVVKSGEASTVEEIRVKASVNKSIMDLLASNNCFGDLPESNQLTMF